MNLEEITRKACMLALKVGEFIRNESLQLHTISIEEKALNSLVSFVDKTAEDMLVEELNKITPNCGFITEEETENILNREIEWIIDPLDGTTNFLYGIPNYCISLGMRWNEKLSIGIIYEINRNELFYAFNNGGAFLNQKPIQVSQRATLSESLLATGFPYYDFENLENYMKALHELMRKVRGIRRIGSAALDLAYVASGRFDGFFEYSLHPWDVAGGSLIIIEAGGKVTDFNNQNQYLFGHQIIATNALIHADLLNVLNKSFS